MKKDCENIEKALGYMAEAIQNASVIYGRDAVVESLCFYAKHSQHIPKLGKHGSQRIHILSEIATHRRSRATRLQSEHILAMESKETDSETFDSN